jgi:hypothetical protein
MPILLRDLGFLFSTENARHSDVFVCKGVKNPNVTVVLTNLTRV